MRAGCVPRASPRRRRRSAPRTTMTIHQMMTICSRRRRRRLCRRPRTNRRRRRRRRSLTTTTCAQAKSHPRHTPATPPSHPCSPHTWHARIFLFWPHASCAFLSSRAEQPLRSRTTLLSSARAAPPPPLWAPPRKTRDGSAQQMDARGEACTCCGECIATAVTVSVAIVFAFLACYLLRRHKGRRLCRARIRKRTWEVSVRAPAPGHELLPPAACAAVMRGSRVASPCTSPLSQCTSPQMHARPLSALLPLVGKKVEGS